MTQLNLFDIEKPTNEAYSISPKRFKSLGEAVSWFKSKGYTWYTNTIKDPREALKGLVAHLKLNEVDLNNLIKNDKIMVGECKGTYLIYFKEK